MKMIKRVVVPLLLGVAAATCAAHAKIVCWTTSAQPGWSSGITRQGRVHQSQALLVRPDLQQNFFYIEQLSPNATQNQNLYVWQEKSGDDWKMYIVPLNSTGGPTGCYKRLIPDPGLAGPLCFDTDKAVSHQSVSTLATSTYQTGQYSFLTADDASGAPLVTQEFADDDKTLGPQQQALFYNSSNTAPTIPDFPDRAACQPFGGDGEEAHPHAQTVERVRKVTSIVSSIVGLHGTA